MPGIFDSLVDFTDNTTKPEQQDTAEAQSTEAPQMTEETPQGELKDVKKDFYSKDFYEHYKR